MPEPGFVGSAWYLKQRILKRYASVDPRPVVWASLKNDSFNIAVQKSAGVWSSFIE